ncbi:MAG: hypothetical protein MUF13_14305 [Akkermansiaceae bacterium]|jgi:hypothetical protein|nr:hypothetical protein [Akkermansiaceae bacterium]
MESYLPSDISFHPHNSQLPAADHESASPNPAVRWSWWHNIRRAQHPARTIRPPTSSPHLACGIHEPAFLPKAAAAIRKGTDKAAIATTPGANRHFGLKPNLAIRLSGDHSQFDSGLYGDRETNGYPIRAVRTADWKLIRNLHTNLAWTSHSDLLRSPFAQAST